MRILYHLHAKQRMEQRGISEADVEAALTECDTSVPADKGRTRYIKNTDKNGSINVVAIIRKVTDTHFVVYTAFRERGNRD